MQTIAITGLVQMDLNGGPTVRLCDGGFITWGGNTFISSDATFGVIGSVESLVEGIGDEIPALEITLLPPVSSAPGDLSAPGYQNSLIRFWIAEYDPDTGDVLGTPNLMFSGQIDQITMLAGTTRREIAMTVVSTAERLFLHNDGNTLTPRWHKSVWSGEQGHDNAVGLATGVAWGVKDRPNANSGVTTSGGGERAINGWGAPI